MLYRLFLLMFILFILYIYIYILNTSYNTCYKKNKKNYTAIIVKDIYGQCPEIFKIQ